MIKHTIHISPACPILSSKQHLLKAIESFPADAVNFVIQNNNITFESNLLPESPAGFTFDSEIVYRLRPSKFK